MPNPFATCTHNLKFWQCLICVPPRPQAEQDAWIKEGNRILKELGYTKREDK